MNSSRPKPRPYCFGQAAIDGIVRLCRRWTETSPLVPVPQEELDELHAEVAAKHRARVASLPPLPPPG